MSWVFLYAEISPQELSKITGVAPLCSLPAVLDDFGIIYRGISRKWGGAMASLAKHKGSSVNGSISLLTEKELVKLDNLLPTIYKKTKLNVKIPLTGDTFECLVYYIDTSLDLGVASNEYLKAIIKHIGYFWSGKITKEELTKPIPVAPKKEDPPVEAEEKEAETKKKKKKKKVKEEEVEEKDSEEKSASDEIEKPDTKETEKSEPNAEKAPPKDEKYKPKGRGRPQKQPKYNLDDVGI